MTTTLNASTAGAGGFIATGDNSGSLALQTAGTTAVTIDTSQNVGIGTNSPSYKVDVNKGSSGSVARFGYSSGTYGYIYADTQQAYFSSDSSANNSWSCNNSTNYLVTYTNGSERMRIDSSGMLGIGTTSAASSRLSISGTATLCMMKNESATSGTAQTTILFRDNGDNTRGSITVSTSGTVYNTTSDYRLKENITPMTGALVKVSQLKPVTYTWKETGDCGQGFIAHELAEVVPECVTGEKDAVETRDGKEYIVPQGIDTSYLVATLTAAIQEAKALIDTQAETINALTARVVALESK